MGRQQDTVSIGVLGASSFALNHTARAIHEAEGVRFAALATSSPAKAEPFAAFAPDLRVHGEYEALLADPEVDAVYIPLPNHLHVEWTLKALEAGKHVLCEKPIALRAEEIETLIEARDRTGLVAAEAYMIVHHPQWHMVRRLIDEGAIGRLRHVDAVQTFDIGEGGDNIRDRAEYGGGSLRDVGVYTFGGMRFAARAEPVEAALRTRRRDGVDIWAQAVGTMRYREGEFSFSSVTATHLPLRQETVFTGEDGLIRLTAPCNAGVSSEAQVHVVRGAATIVEAFPTVRQYVLEMAAFGRAVRGEEPFGWTLEDSRGNQAMVDLVLASES